jgi:hypothetical protein
MSRHFSPFTREDEKELFKEDVDPNFLDNFRRLYSTTSESCSVEVILDLTHVAVDEIESWEPNEIPIGVGCTYDRYTTTLKLPENIRKLALVCEGDEESSTRYSENSFLSALSALITKFQCQKILLATLTNTSARLVKRVLQLLVSGWFAEESMIPLGVSVSSPAFQFAIIINATSLRSSARKNSQQF